MRRKQTGFRESGHCLCRLNCLTFPEHFNNLGKLQQAHHFFADALPNRFVSRVALRIARWQDTVDIVSLVALWKLNVDKPLNDKFFHRFVDGP